MICVCMCVCVCVCVCVCPKDQNIKLVCECSFLYFGEKVNCVSYMIHHEIKIYQFLHWGKYPLPLNTIWKILLVVIYEQNFVGHS